jgi:hypothetical protein
VAGHDYEVRRRILSKKLPLTDLGWWGRRGCRLFTLLSVATAKAAPHIPARPFLLACAHKVDTSLVAQVRRVAVAMLLRRGAALKTHTSLRRDCDTSIVSFIEFVRINKSIPKLASFNADVVRLGRAPCAECLNATRRPPFRVIDLTGQHLDATDI